MAVVDFYDNGRVGNCILAYLILPRKLINPITSTVLTQSSLNDCIDHNNDVMQM